MAGLLSACVLAFVWKRLKLTADIVSESSMVLVCNPALLPLSVCLAAFGLEQAGLATSNRGARHRQPARRFAKGRARGSHLSTTPPPLQTQVGDRGRLLPRHGF